MKLLVRTGKYYCVLILVFWHLNLGIKIYIEIDTYALTVSVEKLTILSYRVLM